MQEMYKKAKGSRMQCECDDWNSREQADVV